MADEKSNVYISQKNIIITIIIVVCIIGITMSSLFFTFICVLIIILLAIKYFYDIDIFVKFNDALNEFDVDFVIDDKKRDDIVVPKPKIPKPKPLITTDEVFNIPGNKYSYDQAQTLCKAYGSTLASYSQVEDAYKNGGEWCNYGWSKDQLALFPTQKTTYDNLQSIKGHENDCGRPGVNGGYMANTNNKYGVNCYGKKPAITETEKKLMEINKNYPPETNLDKESEKWKKQIDNILISPFNSKSWYKL